MPLPCQGIDIQRVQSGSPFETAFGFCRALRVGDRVLVSGTAPVTPDGSIAPDAAAQMRRCLEIIEEAVTQLGATMNDVIRTRMFLVDATDAPLVGRVHAEVFGASRPVATMVVVADLLDPAWRVEVEAEAAVAGRPC